MTKFNGLRAYSVLLFIFAFVAVVTCVSSWETTLYYVWTVDEPIRTLGDFATQEKFETSFRLCNTARVPLRIVGASSC